MLRIAFAAMAVVIGLLVILALQDDSGANVPDATITLGGAEVALYPQADPGSVWYFAAPSVEYQPDSQESTLLNISDGRRTIEGETDFTLTSERVTIDRSDNIRGELMHAHLVEDEIDLHMEAKGERMVLINQESGQFEVPRATMTGPDLGASVFEDMRISFDFTDFESGGPGTVGYSEFIVRSPESEPQ